MYSVVLMAAMTTGNYTPDFIFRCRGFCRGWNRACSCACSGTLIACHGCHGCHGYTTYYGCHGYRTYQGGLFCYGCVGCYGCFGWGHSHYAHWYACYGGWTCYGCAGTTMTHGQPVIYQPAPTIQPRTPLPEEDTQVQAKITLVVPADAKVYVDGQPTQLQSERRVFTTPPLQTGKTYYYDFQVEVTRNGRVIRETQQVVIQPGRTQEVSFANLGMGNPDIRTAQNQE